MTYVLMFGLLLLVKRTHVHMDWREVMVFDYSRAAKTLCEETGKDLFNSKKVQVRPN